MIIGASADRLECRFDAYSAGCQYEVERVGEAFLDGLEGMCDFEQATARHGYKSCSNVVLAGSVVGKISWGGDYCGNRVLATVQGEYSPKVAAALRRVCPNHHVTRADVCADFISPTVFEELTDVGLDLAREYDLSRSMPGDWIKCDKSRTLYIGSRQSVAYMRIYHRGQKVGGNPDLIRCEVEFKPQRHEARSKCATMAPGEFYGLTTWTRDLAERLGEGTFDRVKAGTTYSPTNVERAFRHMLKQYGPVMKAYAAMAGGSEEMFRQIEARLLELE